MGLFTRLALRLAGLQAGSLPYSQTDIPFSYTFRPDIDPAYAESMMNL
jgi:hypothetical protein